MSLRDSVSSEEDIYNIAYLLYNDLKDPDVPIRLIGVTVGNLEQSTYKNMTIYDFIIIKLPSKFTFYNAYFEGSILFSPSLYLLDFYHKY